MPTLPSMRCSRSALATRMLLLGALALAGCVTSTEVSEIVARSNAAMLAGHLGTLPTADANGQQVEPWMEVSGRIDALAAAHPNDKKTIAPLRIRQALLLLAHKQFNLAREAFNAAPLGDLVTARDLALKRNQEHLLWWFAASPQDNWSAEDRRAAQEALKALLEEQRTKVAKEIEIRDYLAELRAHIGIADARRGTTRTEEERRKLTEAVTIYAEILTPADLAAIAGRTPPAKELTTDVRRQLRARGVLLAAQKLNREDSLNVDTGNPDLNALIK